MILRAVGWIDIRASERAQRGVRSYGIQCGIRSERLLFRLSKLAHRLSIVRGTSAACICLLLALAADEAPRRVIAGSIPSQFHECLKTIPQPLHGLLIADGECNANITIRISTISDSPPPYIFLWHGWVGFATRPVTRKVVPGGRILPVRPLPPATGLSSPQPAEVDMTWTHHRIPGAGSFT
jgi:hypothetical protein